MAITVTQGFKIGALSSNKGSTTWIARCAKTDSIADVKAAFWAAVPRTHCGLSIDDIVVEHVNDDLYLAEANYVSFSGSSSKIPESSGPVLDFDTTGETMHITTSLGYRSYRSNAEDPIDCKSVIGWDGKKVHGVDVVLGVYRFSEEWTLDASVVTPSYRKGLKSLTGKINSASFRGFNVGEVRFDGAAGRRVKNEKWSVTFRFAVSNDRENFSVGGITVIKKGGWEYMDVWMRDDVDSTGNKGIIQVPDQVNLHQVYEKADFGSLGIGTGAI